MKDNTYVHITLLYNACEEEWNHDNVNGGEKMCQTASNVNKHNESKHGKWTCIEKKWSGKTEKNSFKLVVIVGFKMKPARSLYNHVLTKNNINWSNPEKGQWTLCNNLALINTMR